jgi:hypothetical protein
MPLVVVHNTTASGIPGSYIPEDVFRNTRGWLARQAD